MATTNELKSFDLNGKGFRYDPDTGVISRHYKNGKSRDLGCVNAQGYVHIKVDSKSMKAHRLAWFLYYKEEPPEFIDHINLDKTDNRIVNLRAADRRGNNCNQGLRSDNSSGYKGVCRTPNGKRWAAYASVCGKRHHIGYFDDILDAADAAKNARIKFNGEFAR